MYRSRCAFDHQAFARQFIQRTPLVFYCGKHRRHLKEFSLESRQRLLYRCEGYLLASIFIDDLSVRIPRIGSLPQAQFDQILFFRSQEQIRFFRRVADKKH